MIQDFLLEQNAHMFKGVNIQMLFSLSGSKGTFTGVLCSSVEAWMLEQGSSQYKLKCRPIVSSFLKEKKQSLTLW